MIAEMWWTHGKLVHLFVRFNTLDLARKTVLCSCSKTLNTRSALPHSSVQIGTAN